MTKGTTSKGGQKGAGEGRMPATPPRRSARVSRALVGEGVTTDTKSAGKGPAPELGGSPGAVATGLAIKDKPKGIRIDEQLTGSAPALMSSAKSANARNEK
ncbi:unnamed protein product, partial [Laminaria digitata]